MQYLKVPESHKVLQTFYIFSLKRNEEHNELFKFLLETKENLQKSNAYEKDEIHMRWRQGALQLIEDILEVVETSKDRLTKLQNKKGIGG